MSMDDTKAMMQSLARALDDILNRDGRSSGFVLLIFDENSQEGSRTNYVSNCDRKDMIAALKEVTGRFDGQPQQSGRA